MSWNVMLCGLENWLQHCLRIQEKQTHGAEDESLQGPAAGMHSCLGHRSGACLSFYLLGDKMGLITTVPISNSPCGLNVVKESGCGMPAWCRNTAKAVDASKLECFMT